MTIMGQLGPTLAAAINAMFLLSIIFRPVSATDHIVGGPTGWDLASDMRTWASQTVFITGDNLVFVYKPDHDVIEVGERGYEQCQIQSPIHTHGGGNVVIPLMNPGTRYFVCGNPIYCFQGLKIQINVVLLENLSSSPINETDSIKTGSYATAPIGSHDQVKSSDDARNLCRSCGLPLSRRRNSPPKHSQGSHHPPRLPAYDYPPTEFPPTYFPPSPSDNGPTDFPPTYFPPSPSDNGNEALTVKDRISYFVHYWYWLVLVLIGVPGSVFWFFRAGCTFTCESGGGSTTSQNQS